MAEEVKSTATEAEQEQGAATAEQGQAAKTYTQEEVDRLLQAESDRRVTAALKKAQAKEADRTREAQKLAAMNEQQKYEYQLEQREKAIEEKERQLTVAANKAEAAKILAETGLVDMVDFVVAEDAETMNANIKAVQKCFKKAVEAEVTKRLGGKTPEKAAEKKELTSKDFSKMSISEMQRLMHDSPEEYNRLVGAV